MKPGTAFLGFIVSMAALLFEAFILKRWGLSKDHNMYCFLLPAEYFLLSFAVTVRVEHREIYKKMRVSGIVIYFSHMFFCFIVKGVFFAISYVLGVNLSNSMIMCILTIGLSTCFGFVLERLSHTDKFQFLRYLYS